MPADVLPAEGVLRAARRWLDLLERSSVAQAAVLLRADTRYTDLSLTQYATALDWLAAVGLIEDGQHGRRLAAAVREAGDAKAQLLYQRSLEASAPAWLADADALVEDQAGLPQDALGLAAVFGLSEQAALLGIRQVHGRIDLAARAAVGAQGEAALVALLEQRWPGSTHHVALADDGLGYDVAFRLGGRTWHLEVKSTSRRGRLTVHLTRNELEAGAHDPAWQLVVVGLDGSGAVGCLATADHRLLSRRAPVDASPVARWESAGYRLGPLDLRPGLPFLDDPAPAALAYPGGAGASFAWMPPLVPAGQEAER